MKWLPRQFGLAHSLRDRYDFMHQMEC